MVNHLTVPSSNTTKPPRLNNQKKTTGAFISSKQGACRYQSSSNIVNGSYLNVVYAVHISYDWNDIFKYKFVLTKNNIQLINAHETGQIFTDIMVDFSYIKSNVIIS